MKAFQEEHPEYSRGLLSYTLEYIVATTWPTNSLGTGYNDCDKSCEIGQTEPCGCTCTVDPYDWTDDEVRGWTRNAREGLRCRGPHSILGVASAFDANESMVE